MQRIEAREFGQAPKKSRRNRIDFYSEDTGRHSHVEREEKRSPYREEPSWHNSYKEEPLYSQRDSVVHRPTDFSESFYMQEPRLSIAIEDEIGTAHDSYNLSKTSKKPFVRKVSTSKSKDNRTMYTHIPLGGCAKGREMDYDRVARVDAMPLTQRYQEKQRKTNAENAVQNAKYTDKRPSAENKTKALMVIYICAIVAIIVALVITGVVISQRGNEVENLSSSVTDRLERLASQEIELARLENHTYLTGLAVQEGMVQINGTQEIFVIELLQPAPTEIQTGWFDSFSRWLSGSR